MSETRTSFKAQLGFFVVAAGSAIGLGNIWRFPYLVGQNGGGAFVLLYLFFAIAIGGLAILAEVFLGRLAQKNAVDAFTIHTQDSRSPWKVAGFIGVLGSFLIMLYYPVVAGWTVEYIFRSPSLVHQPHETFGNVFGAVASGTTWAIVTAVFVTVLTNVIVACGLVKGTEKAGMILMPVLFVVLVFLALRSLTLENAGAGLRYYLAPDFSKITMSSVRDALGQAFFSLSIGMGVMITLGSYLRKESCSVKSAFSVMAADTLVAFVAGLIIMPALFAYNIEPGAGPGLTFIGMVEVFANMAAGGFWASVFFFLMFVAALTSTISLAEVLVTYVSEKCSISRKKATVYITAVEVVGNVLVILNFTGVMPFGVFGMGLFDLFDWATSHVTIPLAALLTCLYVGIYHRQTILAKASVLVAPSFTAFVKYFLFVITYVLPVVIALILISGFV